MRTDSGLKKNRTKIQMVLTALVILSVVRQFFLGNYHNMFLGILTLILFMVPQFLDRKLSVTIPPGLETVILIFIFSAEILGEINAFYVKIPIWDTILHTTNGFLMAAIGFALIDLFNRSDRFSIKMSPYAPSGGVQYLSASDILQSIYSASTVPRQLPDDISAHEAAAGVPHCFSDSPPSEPYQCEVPSFCRLFPCGHNHTADKSDLNSPGSLPPAYPLQLHGSYRPR